MAVAAPARTYSATDVCRLAGVTYRSLDYWVRTGYVTPSVRSSLGSGDPRVFDIHDVDRVRLTGRLLDIGISWERLRADDDPYKTADRVMAALMKVVGP